MKAKEEKPKIYFRCIKDLRMKDNTLSFTAGTTYLARTIHYDKNGAITEIAFTDNQNAHHFVDRGKWLESFEKTETEIALNSKN